MSGSTFADDGFALIEGVIAPDQCADLGALVDAAVSTASGTRALLSRSWCQALAAYLQQHPALAALLPAHYVAAQCTYFTKGASNNWLVPIHQDFSIPVAERVNDAALSGWSEKEATLFVQPPAAVLEQLIAVRLHLDPCGSADGPLQVVPGSHRQGKLSNNEAAAAREATGAVACTLDTGGVLVLRPLLLHASSKAGGTSRRRVLHFLFGPPALPNGLRWPPARLPG